MVAYLSRKGLIPAPGIAGTVAAALVVTVSIVAMAVPGWRLESVVVDSGLPAILPAAAPPLGLTARAAIAFFGAVVIGGAGWFAATLAVRHWPRRPARRLRRESTVDIRPADAHPDAAPRPPVLATRELGDPLWQERVRIAPAPAAGPVAAAPVAPEPVEQLLPDDLDLPLAAFDPGAIPAEPLAMPRFAAHERIETFELTPPPAVRAPARMAEDAIVAPATDATIQGLLARLERGVARRPAPPATAFEDTLLQLRQMAAR
jgi:hypothetical protein